MKREREDQAKSLFYRWQIVIRSADLIVDLEPSRYVFANQYLLDSFLGVFLV